MIKVGPDIDFTDGDTFKRVTVTDSDITSASRVVVSVEKHNTADVNDSGWAYVANVVTVTGGSFDVNVFAFAPDGVPINSESPNESVELVYLTS